MKRHVKCDEAKPSCNRCIKWHGFCEGYDHVAESAAESAAGNEAFEPKATTSAGTPAGTSTVTSSGTAETPPVTTNQNRAYSTSSSSATQASRHTTPLSDVSVAEHPAKTPAVPVVVVKRELVDDSQQARRDPDTENDDDDDDVLVVPRQTLVKREHPDDDEDQYSTYSPPTASQQQPFFDLALVHGAAQTAFPLEPNYNSVMFASQGEKAYFDSWLTLAPNLGGGWFPSHLWTITIPQLCCDEPAVRFAAIAIGAMAQAMAPAPALRGSASNASDVSSAARAAPHYRSALTYYGHALRLVRLGSASAAADKAPSHEKERAAVLSCLLFVCFEALQGHREEALRHITHGLQIVDQFLTRSLPARALSAAHQQQAEQQHGVPTGGGGGGGDDAEWQRRRQRQRQRDRQLGLLSREGGLDGGGPGGDLDGAPSTDGGAERPSDALTRVLTRSPAPYVLEDEVMQVFRRLDFQAWSLGVFRLRRTRPADIKFQALDALNPATIPARFDSLGDARRWWDLVQHWILQFPRYMVAALQRYMDDHPDAAARATAAGRMLDICDVPGAREIQRGYLQCLERWYAAFDPLYDAMRRHKLDRRGRGEDAEAAYLQAASLKIPYLLAWIGVSSLVYSDYEAMYQLTPQFRELNRLAALVLPKQPRYTWSPFGGSAAVAGGGAARGDLFTMDNGPTMALFVVSCKCRVEAVRDESIRLLAAYPRRDGFWDSKILWAIADWNRIIEAENETEGSLYEQWLRLRQREAIFDETKPEVQMTAWVKNKETGQFEKLTQTVRWDP